MTWHGKSVSVVLPTYNEKDSIGRVIDGFFDTGYVDEVVVVNNNAVAGTDEAVARTAARLVYESRQGFGYSVRRGLHEAKGELIILSEPDGTFFPRDAVKLLAYSGDFEMVLGTRTTKEMIWTGANMGWFLRLGNYVVAKLLELVFNTPSITDMGCTMRLIRKDALERIEPQFTVGGSHFNPEMVVLAALHGVRFIEVPVNFTARVGTSSVTGSKLVAFGVGLRMLWLVARYRLASVLPKRA
ncbi:MAG: glycosyltransferase family 2 protein [Candidatus Rokubacteria bacterium]|nr:glycosyltransferase family 2 protein [Candidatus Rokubacteria bacterium]